MAEPVNVFVNTYGTARQGLADDVIAEKVKELFDLRPAAIEKRLGLRNPIYRETAAYGHMGRTPVAVDKELYSIPGAGASRHVELFTWERLDMVDTIRKAFDIGR